MKIKGSKFNTSTVFRAENGAFVGEVTFLGSRPCVLYRVDTINGYAGNVRSMKEARKVIENALKEYFDSK